MDGGEAALQSLGKIVVVEFAVTKGPERWRIGMRARTAGPHRMASAAKPLQERFSSALLAVQRMAGGGGQEQQHKRVYGSSH
ncbi:hypothetical protein SSBR45G_12680 [Bradyrhizobium sp. SSBR45G]|nr:hypothetical protein SSBR45G_12680 [Bradyrhizobium sp. SSBR45G]GLH83156.1 hypothetical protein SSBR45R_06160 [Bradyrhizobium sp. SSBR45R]